MKRVHPDTWPALFVIVVIGIGCAGIIECWLAPERGVVDDMFEPRGACHGCP